MPSVPELIRRKYQKELIRRLQEHKIENDDDLRRQARSIATLEEFDAVDAHMTEVYDNPEIYSAPPPPLAPLEERNAEKRRILKDVVVVDSLDPDAPIFRELFADEHPGNVVNMLKHAHSTLKSYDNPDDYVVEFVYDRGVAVDYQIVPRNELPPEELSQVIDSFGEDDAADAADDLPKDAYAQALDEVVENPDEDGDSVVVNESGVGPKYTTVAEQIHKTQIEAQIDADMVEIGSSNTILDSQFKPPEYSDLASDHAYKAMQARRVVFEESPELLAARRDIMFLRHKLEKHYRNETPE